MSETYTTIERDRLDTICYRHYGHLVGSVEAVLAANPRLSGVTSGWMPAGVIVSLPDLPAPAAARLKLW